jgi:ribonucleoside-diphosphate reductase alpha chain
MELNNEILSEVTIFSKYAKYLPELKRRETWHELVTRNMRMHQKQYPAISEEIESAYSYVYDKKVLPSMRSLQFGGRPIELAHNRIYNCAYLPVDHLDAFSEMMFLLLGGTGGGYSVQRRHVDKLPLVLGVSTESRRFLVGDSIEGWADAIKVLVEAHFLGKSKPVFDLRDIREKGAELVTTGGKAPGPEPLRVCLDILDREFTKARGSKLSPLQVHDIVCHIADAVMAGGIRRAALICLFDRDDQDMLTCKEGEWYIHNGQRGRANNSAVLPRGDVSQAEFFEIMRKVEDSGSGEPGVYWTSNLDWGTNPCCEIALRPYQFCNLCEVNASDVTDQHDLNNRAKAAAFIGTLQAGYTDFHYLRPCWKETTESDALIGVGMTGIGSGAVLNLDLSEAADEVLNENLRVSNLIGINRAARTTTVKPAGTSSLTVGSSSGIHAWHNTYYVRRMRVGYNEPLFKYMVDKMPRLVEPDELNPTQAVLTFPQKAPEGAIIRTESVLDLLERVRKFNIEWVHAGHLTGDNTHNVSCTVSVKDGEWDDVAKWMWENRNDYNGIAVLPYDGGTYIQAPFEDITQEEYENLAVHLEAIDLTAVHEEQDFTEHAQEAACAGGTCEK